MRRFLPLLMTLAAANALSAGDAPRDVDTHHLFSPPESRNVWERRAAELRAQILFSAGLYPMPDRTLLNPRVTGRVEGPDYIIENVALETLPGFYLCGNLYKPRNKKGPFPAIVNPHGHWKNGRLETEPDVPTAEPPPAKPAPGKGNLVAIGVNLARQGYVVFAYDMAGYNDTDQIEHRKFAARPEEWLWGVSILGLQLWNSIRVVDYLEELPDVDRKRIGVTGASGGGTQTFLLCAVDDRIKAAVPVNMISAYMQGGCLCENGPGLRVGTDNVEIGAMLAPKPLMMVAATGDWTKNNPTEEAPTIAKVYALYRRPECTAVHQFNYQHNYNVESRNAMYAWFARWLLKDDHAERYLEQPFEIDTKSMRVWNEQNPRPKDALNESQLIDYLKNRGEAQLAELWPKNRQEIDRFKRVMTRPLACSLGINLHSNAPVSLSSDVKSHAVLILYRGGQESAVEALRKACQERGQSVHALKLQNPEATPDELWAKFYTCYNRTVLGNNVQNAIEQVAALKRAGASRIDLIGVGPAGPTALFVRAFCPDIGHAVIDMDHFNGGNDGDYIAKLYAPGLRRAGDIRTAAVLGAPGSLCLHNTGGEFRAETITSVYSAASVPLHIESRELGTDEILKWLEQ